MEIEKKLKRKPDREGSPMKVVGSMVRSSSNCNISTTLWEKVAVLLTDEKSLFLLACG